MIEPPSLRSTAFRLIATLGVASMLALLVLPAAALVLRVPPARLLARLGDPLVLDAMRLSLATSLAATGVVVVLGMPVAWLLATRQFRGKRLLELFVDLPMVLPPTVAGLALLLALGRSGLAGSVFTALGVTLPFTTAGVVVAQASWRRPSSSLRCAPVSPRWTGATWMSQPRCVPTGHGRSSPSCCRWRFRPWSPAP
jgi:ABC-type sulfate transport system permease component